MASTSPGNLVCPLPTGLLVLRISAPCTKKTQRDPPPCAVLLGLPPRVDTRCISLSIADLEGGAEMEAALRSDLRALTLRICHLVMGEAFERRLAEDKLELGGALSMRFYPQARQE